jgi:hypothetical protein
VGIPILVLAGVGCWILVSFERFLVVHWLKEDVPAMTLPSLEGTQIWTRFKPFLTHPTTWTSPLYLFLKFPIGIATFLILTILISLTVAFLSMPFTYGSWSGFQVGFFTDPSLPTWHIEKTSDALLASLIGMMLWPVTLHVTTGLAWVHAKFAKIMLSVSSMGMRAAFFKAQEAGEARS